uniref:YkgJ family cysteine cluster protein n=1 Tax=Bacillus multifaciens TaxID=3068506 RepID=UPI003F499198
MGRNNVCFCGSGKKQKKCHSNVEQNSYVANLYKKYSEIDNIISDYRDKHKEFENHPCGKGCYNCCYDVFSISMLEFELLLEELRNIGLEFAEKVFEKSLKYLEVLRTINPNLYNRLEEDVTLQKDVALKDVTLYSQTERFPFSCPMLDDSKGSCLVYNKRPMVCRLFGTTHDSFSVTLDSRDESSICEHIPSAEDNVMQTPEVDISYLRINNMLETKYSGERLLPREYPIVYWFKVYHDKNSKKGRPVYTSLVPSFYYKKPGSITLAELMP